MAKTKAPPPRRVNSLLDDEDGTPKPAAKPKAKPKADEEDFFTDDTPAAAPKPRAAARPAKTTVALGPDRKLTKKDQGKLAKWAGAQRGKTIDTFFARQTTEARKKFGQSGVFMGSEAHALVIGIPTPALAFEYVISQDCFPLGLIFQIVAKYGVGKSAIVAEFGRWFNLANGGTVLCENETKFNPLWYISIMSQEVFDRMPLHRCKSVEDWQRHLTWHMKEMQQDMVGTKDDPGPGRTFPVLFAVDSIMGKMSEENQEKILGSSVVNENRPRKKGDKKPKSVTGEGYAQARSFPIEAGSITKYMRTVPHLMDQWPFAIVLVNHLRTKTDDMGNLERNKTGGEQVNFQESFELEIKKVGGQAQKIKAAEFEGIQLKLSCEKNSFGPTGRSAMVRMLWWHEDDPAGGHPVQRTVWDWDWATVHLLNGILNGEVSTYLKARLKKIGFHIEVTSAADVDNAAWSKSVGMKSKDDAVTWAELGALIREDVALMDKLRDALCIARRPFLRGDYLAQMEKMTEDVP